MSRLLLIERAIIESCNQEGKTIFDISNDTGMELSMVNALCIRLNKKGILRRYGSLYRIENSACDFIAANEVDNLKKEVEEVTSALVNNYFSKTDNRSLKLQKVYVDKTEEKILYSLLDQLNSFVSELQVNNRNNPRNLLKSRKVIMWGHAQYNDLIDQTIEMAN